MAQWDLWRPCWWLFQPVQCIRLVPYTRWHLSLLCSQHCLACQLALLDQLPLDLWDRWLLCRRFRQWDHPLVPWDLGRCWQDQLDQSDL